MVGTHRRIRLEELLAYKDKMQAESAASHGRARGRKPWARVRSTVGRRAKPILVARKTEAGGDRFGLSQAMLIASTWALCAHARAAYRAGADDAWREEGFELTQWALQTGAADALSQMSVRFAKGGRPLATLVRERQDLVARRQGETRRLDAAVGRADANAAQEARIVVVALDLKLAKGPAAAHPVRGRQALCRFERKEGNSHVRCNIAEDAGF